MPISFLCKWSNTINIDYCSRLVYIDVVGIFRGLICKNNLLFVSILEIMFFLCFPGNNQSNWCWVVVIQYLKDFHFHKSCFCVCVVNSREYQSLFLFVQMLICIYVFTHTVRAD